MEHYSTSIFSRCRRVFLRKHGLQQQSSQTNSTSSWPHAFHVPGFYSTYHDDEYLPLLNKEHDQPGFTSRRKFSFRGPSLISKRRSSILAPPQWCRQSLSNRVTTLTTYLLVTLLFFTSSTSAAPLEHTYPQALAKRQAIPDRFGNTGNGPASVASQPSSRVVTTTITSSTVNDVQSLTSTRTPTTSTRISSVIVTSPSVAPTVEESSFEADPTSTPAATLPPVAFTSDNAPLPTITPPDPGPENQLQRTKPQTSISPAAIAGIVVGGVILIALITGTAFLLYRRKKAREIEEIPIRRSKLGSRLGCRILGNHYDDSIARSRSRLPGAGKFTERSISSRGSDTQEKKQTPALNTTHAKNKNKSLPPTLNITKAPVSPSIYSPTRLTRATRISTMTFGSVGGWLDKSTIGRPQPAFTGTPSQLLDAPKPLFAPWVDKGRISPPRPARPGSAEPLGRLSGMGYGLGIMGRAG